MSRPVPTVARRTAAVVAALALLTGPAACATPTSDRQAGPGPTVGQVIADPALAACLAAALGLPDATAPVPEDALTAITELTCDGQTSAQGPIRSLAGIEQLPSLNELDAPRNEISDLAPLAALPRLGTLTLTANLVRDLSPLAGLQLFDLGLSQNPVGDSPHSRGRRR